VGLIGMNYHFVGDVIAGECKRVAEVARLPPVLAGQGSLATSSTTEGCCAQMVPDPFSAPCRPELDIRQHPSGVAEALQVAQPHLMGQAEEQVGHWFVVVADIAAGSERAAA
jgi:hypothetical protein